MATGDILSVTVQPEGWQASVVIAGITQYAAFNNGFGGPFGNDPDPTATPPGVPTLVLTVHSAGFDATGTPITVTRYVYGTVPIRNVYDAAGDQNFNNQTTDGTNLTVLFALSDNIFAGDTIISAAFLSNFVAGAPVFAPIGMNFGFGSTQTRVLTTRFGDIAVPANTVVSIGGINWTFPNSITYVGSQFSCASAINASGTYTLVAVAGPITLKAGQVYGSDAGYLRFTVASDTVVATGAGTAVAITVVIGTAAANVILGSPTALTAVSGTMTFPLGAYANIVVPGVIFNNAISGLSVTNGSTYAYPKVVANWSDAINRVLTTNDTLRLCAFHAFAKNGMPVARVEVRVTDGTHTQTVAITGQPMIDVSAGDAVPVIEYVANLNLTGFTQGAVLTANFKAYPWVGDSSAVFDTGATATPGYPVGTPEPTAHAGPKTHIYDGNNTYNPNIAVVDSTNGNDTTGATATTLAAAAATPFATIAGAIGLLVGSNGLYKATKTNQGRNNLGGAHIYLRGNSPHAWMGGTAYETGATAPNTWLTIQNYPSESPTISSGSGATFWGSSVGTKIKFQGINWSVGASVILFNTSFTTMLWFDQCTINLPYSAAIYVIGFSLLTRCNVINFASLGGYAGYLSTCFLVRGNTISLNGNNTATFANAIMMVGNWKPSQTFSMGMAFPTYSSATIYCGANLSKVGTGSGPVTISLSASLALVLGKGSPVSLLTAGNPVPIVGFLSVAADVSVPVWPSTVSATIDFRPVYDNADIPFDIPAWNGVAANLAGTGQGIGGTNAPIRAYASNAIYAFNFFTQATWGNTSGSFGITPDPWGSSVIQNVTEVIFGAQPAMQMAADGSSAPNVNNVLCWHNTILGQRTNGPYDENNNGTAWRRLWSMKNNAHDGLNIKTDTFTGVNVNLKNNVAITTTGVQTIQLYGPNGYNATTYAGSTLIASGFSAIVLSTVTVGTDPTNGGGTTVSVNVTTLSSTVNVGTAISGSGQSPTRVGNWSQLYGVSAEGQYNPQVMNSNAFLRIFPGLRSYQSQGSPPLWFVFRRREAWTIPTYATLGTTIGVADIGTLKTVSLYTLNPQYPSDHRYLNGTETFNAGDHLSNAQAMNASAWDLVFQGPVTLTATPQNVQVLVLAGPGSGTLASGTQLQLPYPGDIRCETQVNVNTMPTSLSLRVRYGTLVLTDNMLLTGADGTLQVTVNPGQAITLTTTPQTVNVTGVSAQGNGRNQLVGESMHSPSGMSLWGNGDYHPNVGSPLLTGSRAQLLPYDINGTTRSPGFQISGAYNSNLSIVESEAY